MIRSIRQAVTCIAQVPITDWLINQANRLKNRATDYFSNIGYGSDALSEATENLRKIWNQPNSGLALPRPISSRSGFARPGFQPRCSWQGQRPSRFIKWFRKVS